MGDGSGLHSGQGTSVPNKRGSEERTDLFVADPTDGLQLLALVHPHHVGLEVVPDARLVAAEGALGVLDLVVHHLDVLTEVVALRERFAAMLAVVDLWLLEQDAALTVNG